MYPPDGPHIHDSNRSTSDSKAASEAIAGALNFLLLLGALYLMNQAWMVGRQALSIEVAGIPIYMGLGLVAGLLLAGMLIDYLREIRLWRPIALIQIAIAIAAAVYGFFSTVEPITRAITLLAALITVSNGVSKFREVGRKKLERYKNPTDH